MNEEPIVLTTANGAAPTIATLEMPFGPRPGTYRLSLDFNTLCDAEQYMSGTNCMGAAAIGTPGFQHLRAIFFEAAYNQNGLRTLREAGEMVAACRVDGREQQLFGKLVKAVSDAIVAMSPVKVDAAGN